MGLPRTKLWSFLFRAAEYTGLQVVVQVIGFVVGLAVIRLLSKDEYGTFTVASSIAGTVAVLSDLGLSSALLTVAGRHFREPGGAFAAFGIAGRLQAFLSAGAILVGMLAGFALLTGHGIDIQKTMLLALVAGIAGIGSSRYALAAMLPRVAGRLRQLQRVDLVAAIARGLLTSLVLLVLPLAMAVLLINGVVLMAQAWWIASTNRTPTHASAHEAAERKELLGLVWRQAPSSVLYLFHGQLTVWLITVMGSAGAVADYGALGRLAAILGIVTSVVNAVALPYFARARSAIELRRAFIMMATGLLAITAAGTLFVAIFPAPALLLLGSQYAGLNRELVPMVCAALLTTTASALYGANLAKGWTFPVVAFAAIWLASVVSGIALFDVATVEGAAWFNCWTMALSMASSAALFAYRSAGRGSPAVVEPRSPPGK